jgi:hypothetical protein
MCLAGELPSIYLFDDITNNLVIWVITIKIWVITIAKLWKQPTCPTTDERIMNLWYIYTMKYYSFTRNNDMGFEGKWM